MLVKHQKIGAMLAPRCGVYEPAESGDTLKITVSVIAALLAGFTAYQCTSACYRRHKKKRDQVELEMIFPTPPPHPAVAIIRGGEQRFFGKLLVWEDEIDYLTRVGVLKHRA